MKRVLFINPLKMDLSEGSETSGKFDLTPGETPKENTQDSEHGETLKSRSKRLPTYGCLLTFKTVMILMAVGEAEVSI
jgi:hypothetical protein